MPTLNVLPGALMGYSLLGSQDSVLNVSGGDIGFREHSCCSVVDVIDDARLNLSGGTLHGWVNLKHDAVANVSGGSISGARLKSR